MSPRAGSAEQGKQLEKCGDFLRAIFPDVPESARVLIWSLNGRSSRWFPTTDAAAKFAAGRVDVYVGCALAPLDFNPRKRPDGSTSPDPRCPDDQVAAVGGVWADIDFGEGGHKKRSLPPTIDDALAIANSLAATPSIVLHSGHGLQVWWLLRELLTFSDNAERFAFGDILERWQAALRDNAAAAGDWELDATHDLARILRLPGTFNGKDKPPVEVSCLKFDPACRYELSDLESFLPERRPSLHDPAAGAKPPHTAPAAGSLPSIELRPDRGPSPRKWSALQAADERVLKTWERRRKDLNDTSASGHDMALASFAVQANWTDQEITDLLVSCAIHHGTEIKNGNYYARTIGHARSWQAKRRAHETIDDLVTFGQTEGVEPGDEAARHDALIESLSTAFEIRINRVIRFTTDPPQFRIETARGDIHLGGVEGLIEQRRFRASIAAATGKLIPPQTKIQWAATAQSLLDVCENVDAGQESTERGLVLTWLTKYLRHYPARESGAGETDEALADAASARIPFEKDGWVHLFSPEFSTWITLSERERVGQRQLGVMLRSFGAEPKNVRIGRKVFSTWRFQRYLLGDDPGDVGC